MGAAVTTGVATPRKRKGSDIFQYPRVKAGTQDLEQDPREKNGDELNIDRFIKVSIADIKSESWPSVESSSSEALLSSFNATTTMSATPDVSASDAGYQRRCTDPSLYFAKSCSEDRHRYARRLPPPVRPGWTIPPVSSPSKCLTLRCRGGVRLA